MAESRQHQGLVLRAVRAVRTSMGDEKISALFADLPGTPYGIPPKIYDHRPDLYATGSGLTIVGEAKPPWDVESARTELQLQSFTKYVEMDGSRHLILAVNWVSTATANAVIRSLARDWPSLKHRVHFLDGRRQLVLPTGHQHHAAN